MSLLLSENLDFVTTEIGEHLLVEPVTVTTQFHSRFTGIATISKLGDGWEMDLGRGPVKSQFSDMLKLMARNSGASGVKYK